MPSIVMKSDGGLKRAQPASCAVLVELLDTDIVISQEVKSPEGRVDGPWSWRSCRRSIPYFYTSYFCHALLQIIRIGDPFFTGVD